MKLTLPVPPSLNRMYRTYRGRMLISAEGRDYKAVVEAICLVNRVKPIEGDLNVSISVFRPQKRGDIDNYLKGIFDSLNGKAWRDDSQIKKVTAERFDDKHKPRVEIEIECMK